MRLRLFTLLLTGSLFAGLLSSEAAAQVVLGEGEATAGEGVTAEGEAVVKKPTPVSYGVGLRLRNVRIPRGVLELFVERAAAGISQPGFGLEVSRRKKNFEIQLGLEYESLNASDGIWIDKGESIPADDVDFTEFEKFGWFTIEVSFFSHTQLHKNVALRYGAGAGIGILKGKVVHTDRVCTSDRVDSCTQPLPGGVSQEPYDLPPVFPVINAVVGLQIRPAKNVFVNLEGGLRTALFWGGTVGYVF
jgi:hypothetical protein